MSPISRLECRRLLTDVGIYFRVVDSDLDVLARPKENLRIHSRRCTCDDLAICELEAANAATRWEQAIGKKDNATAIAEDALQAGTEKLGILGESAAESSRGWRCKELRFLLTNQKDSKLGDSKFGNLYSMSDNSGGVESCKGVARKLIGRLGTGIPSGSERGLVRSGHCI